jgi:CMP-N,N'-diacetyllegionaminic acid synthase
VLAVVPARGGSKGIPLKNLQPLWGQSLIAHVADVVRSAGIFDRAVVSTDHLDIAREATKHGLDVPFTRPPELSGDLIGDHPVMLHALEETEALDAKRFDIVVMLQPTCPQRRCEQIVAAVEKLIDEGWDAVWTVSRSDLKYHPLKQLTVGADGKMDYYDPAGRLIIARQQLSPVYYRNGAAYVLTSDALRAGNSLKPERTGALIIDEPFVSIDTSDDLINLSDRR